MPGMSAYRLPVPDLPIFAWERRGMAWFYAPGYLVAAPKEEHSQLEIELNQDGPQTRLAVALRAHAVAAENARRELFSTPYRPVCLTIYLNNRCNLGCDYCYAMAAPAQSLRRSADRVSLRAVAQAAKLVAENCRAGQAPFTLVLHGGGEPTLDWRLADQILDMVEQVAEDNHLPVFRYIATNGVMPPDVADWLIERFDLIGLSCDGPPQIQNAQRPLKFPTGSAPFVERLAHMARQAGKPVQIRATLTRCSMFCQEEIAEYLCRTLGPQEIRVEPVYQGGRAGAQSSLETGMVETYVAQFMQARRVAAGYGVNWGSASTRLGSVYGPYCHIFRGVLNLVPGDRATACFRISQFDVHADQRAMIGWPDRQTEAYFLDETRLLDLRQKLMPLPERCTNCFNQYHCTQGCPDRCPVDAPGEPFSPAADFRCQLQIGLVLALMDELVPDPETNRIYTATLEAHRSGWQ